MFPIYIVSKTYSKSSYYRFQTTFFQCMFPINILPSIHCFPSTNVVSNLNSLFPSYFFVSYLIIMSTYYRSKYFWNVKMGFEQFRFAFSSLSKVKGKLMAFLKNFFLDFSKSVPAQKILITTRFFCLIMLHLIVNCKNHHSEVCHLSKKIIKWVFLWSFNCIWQVGTMLAKYYRRFQLTGFYSE